MFFILAFFLFTVQHRLVSDRLLQLSLIRWSPANSTCCSSVSSVGLDYLLHVNPCLFLEVVNILCWVEHQETFVLEHLDEKVGWSWVSLG